MNYTYDEEGVAFYYFLITALTIYLIPATYSRFFAKKGSILLLAVTLNAVWNAKTSYKPWDPFEILGVSNSVTEEQAGRAFKKLSRKYHPDKAEDKETAAAKFVEISKAYKALTDPVARRNWEEYGNPDGPKGFSLGIALPVWLVSAGNGAWLLALYLIGFGIGIPYLVSKWWTHSKVYTKDQILHSSMGLYFQNLKESMTFRKIFDLLAQSHEFRDEIPQGPDDAAALEKLIDDMNAQIEQVGGEKYSRPSNLTEDYAAKAHTLLYAHFQRLPVSDPHLRAAQEKIVAKACHLTHGMLQIALARQWLQTANHCISMIQNLVQAVPENSSPLLQLPYLDAALVKQARSRRSPIRSVRQLVELPEEERRNLLKSLSDEEQASLMAVAKAMPEVYIDSTKFVTLGQQSVIPGGLVTAKIKISIVKAGEDLRSARNDDVEDIEVENFEFDEDGNLVDSAPIKSIALKDPSGAATPPIHCPRFPNEKRPFWWVVLTNIGNTAIVCPPIKVFDLKDSKVVTLQFTAPNRPGQIAINVHVKSDSLIGADLYKTCTINIAAHRPAPSKDEQWDISGEESDSSLNFGSDDDGAGMSGGCGDPGCKHDH